jgi:hypothetical protein
MINLKRKQRIRSLMFLSEGNLEAVSENVCACLLAERYVQILELILLPGVSTSIRRRFHSSIEVRKEQIDMF